MEKDFLVEEEVECENFPCDHFSVIDSLTEFKADLTERIDFLKSLCVTSSDYDKGYLEACEKILEFLELGF